MFEGVGELEYDEDVCESPALPLVNVSRAQSEEELVYQLILYVGVPPVHVAVRVVDCPKSMVGEDADTETGDSA